MRLDISKRGLEFDPPPALQDGITDRLERLADRYNFIERCEVKLSQQRSWFSAEVTLYIKHQIMRAEERSQDLGSSVDSALDKLERQLHRHKGRLIARSRHTDPHEAPPLTAIEPAEPEEEYTAPRVVRVKTISVKPMSVEEAALQMELLGHDFYVFTNDTSNSLNVVYRRRNGDIGLIQPE